METESNSQTTSRKLESFKKNKHVLKSRQKQYKGNSKEGSLKQSDRKKNKAKYDYLKLLRKERRHYGIKSKPREPVDDDSDNDTEVHTDIKHRKGIKISTADHSIEKKQHMFSKAQKNFHEKKESSEKQKEEHDQKMEQQRRALKKYQNNKKKRHVMLNKKTHKGQPIMKYQMNYLLEKIQAQVGHS